MKLSLPFGKKNSSLNYLLVILLDSEKTTAAVIKHDQGTKIIGKHTEFYTKSFDQLSEDEWLAALDRSISRAEETLPPDISTKKVVFGVPSNWLIQKQIVPKYLGRLKNASKLLDIKPIGFIELTEASVHLMSKQEGMPTQAVFVQLGKDYVTVSIVKGGKIIKTKSSELIDLPAKTIETILQTFVDIEVLPSRIILLGDSADEDMAHTLTNHHWTKTLPFLHHPQITLLSEDFDTKAISFAAVSQMGLSGMGLIQDIDSDIKTYSADEMRHHKKPIHQEVEEETLEDITEQADLDEFGFVKDKDISEIDKDDLKKDIKINDSNHPTPDESVIDDTKEPDYFKSNDLQEPISNSAGKTSALDKSKAALKELNIKLKKSIHSLKSGKGSKKLYFVIPIVIVVIIGFIYSYFYLLPTTLTIHIEPKFDEQNEDITFSLDNGTNVEDGVLSAETKTISVDGETSTATTGTKETGTKAKGSVKIYNSQGNPVNLSGGTEIYSGNTVFTIDSDVQVASASGDIFSGTTPGTASVNVTAKEIGKEYNLPSGTQFTVSGSSNVAAKNESPFTGGDKKESRVVSQDDIDKLTEALPKKLEEEARKKLESTVGKDNTVLIVTSNFKPSKTDFSAGLNSDASNLTLNSEVSFTGVYYNNKDLFNYSKKLLEDKYDQELMASEDEITNVIKNIDDEDEDNITAELTIKALLLPNINIKEIPTKFKGGSLTKVENALRNYPQINSVSISYFPPIPFLPKYLSRTEKNITVKIDTDEK